ncbi:unnamed protein product [Ilex paraguariensis]|uniref:LAZY1 n=1 Tax=Ilex paraguariensis TaxID=185542 RepID=A0ABC8RHZ3_9AQUA
MKLLGWMHRKFRQNSSEPLKDFSIGQLSLDGQEYYPNPNYCSKPISKGQHDNHFRNSFASLEAARVEEGLEDESQATLSELFHGFLAIGTLGADPIVTEPSTPTFAISVENITEKETEVTENELKLINEELERVLGAEARDDGSNDSSGRNSHVSTGRNSHVSTGRSSHGSTITLSGKQIESSENNGNGTITCPLQGYLFGSAIELPETTVGKKEHRASLGELFQKTKLAEEKRTDKETEKSAVHLMKKILKKTMLHPSSRSSTADSGGTADPASAETKLHKILHMFHRKVYPESSTATQKSDKPPKNEIKNNLMYEGRYSSGDHLTPVEDIPILPQGRISKEVIQRFKSQPNPPQVTLGGSNSSGNREYWIKTDTDCSHIGYQWY